MLANVQIENAPNKFRISVCSRSVWRVQTDRLMEMYYVLAGRVKEGEVNKGICSVNHT